MKKHEDIYEERNNKSEVKEEQISRGKNGDYPKYQETAKFYHSQYPSGYEQSRIIKREMNETNPNNNQRKREEYYNYYKESSNSPYNTNIRDINRNANNKFYTPNRFKILNNNFNDKNIMHTYENNYNNYNYNNNQNEEFIDNYQYHETKDIKKKDNKYDSITHIIGYSNLIPLNRMKNLYGNNYSNNFNNNKNEEEYIKEKRKEKIMQEKLRQEEIRLEKIRQERIREEEELRLQKIKNEKLREERRRQEEELKNERLRLEKKRQERLKNDINSRNDNRILNYNNKYYSYKKRNNRSKEDNKHIQKKGFYTSTGYSSSPNIIKNKLISLINVQGKASNIKYPNHNIKLDTYGETFDEKKNKRKYLNIENVKDGIIKNYKETGISKDGEYLISVTSAEKIYDQNYNNENENEYENEYEYENENENINNDNEEDIYEQYNNNIYDVPEKEVEEIISTVTLEKKNLGDNYKFYESKNLYKPNITSFTTHRRRKERTIYGNKEHETREVKTYKIPQDYEFEETDQQFIENNRIPYQDERENNIGDDDNNGEEGERGRKYEEENYEEEEAYY